ncbi:hypothetical protein PIB30_074219 [Stylosanthes scabra]|uniref:Uncharacterized protein n=1 Tax=Stylosanthes scabra TaxID=79078 RepID=A0ABU6XPC8_9FABA|nr:hypothetical protein [Stylosanthes scabra]
MSTWPFGLGIWWGPEQPLACCGRLFVTDFHNNEFRGFHNLEEVQAWLNAPEERNEAGGGPVATAEAIIPQNPLSQQMEAVHLGAGLSMASGSSGGAIGSTGGHWNSAGSSSSGAGSSGGGAGGSATTTAGGAHARAWLDPMLDAAFMHVEDMELILWHACTFFRIGAPIFLPQAARESSQNVVFGFTIILPHNKRGLDFVVYGPVVADERVARQEAAFGMLEKILVATEHTICDFNHRMIGRFRQSYNRFRGEVESM